MTKNFVTYRSSAGSGKTYTLVKEYLKLILQFDSPSYYKRILAITFTNKAAAEMKERVLSQLESFSKAKTKGVFQTSVLNKNDLQLLQDIVKEINKTAGKTVVTDIQILQRSAKTLRHILHNYSDLSISTIDSFVHGIIRNFARDLNLDNEFEIILDQNKVIKNSIESLLSKVGKDKNLTKLVMRFVSRKIDEDKSWNIQEDLEKFGSTIFRDSSKVELDKLKNISPQKFRTILSELYLVISEYENKIFDLAKKGLELIKKSGLEETDFSGGAIPRFFHYTLIQKDWLTPTATLTKMINGEANWLPGRAKEKQHLVDGIQNEITELLQVIIAEAESDEFKKHALRKEIRKSFFTNALLSHIDHFATEWKTENNQVMISDFNKMISEIVLANPAPFIYEKIGERYLHILIDEFQDTAILQWQNFLPLIENSLAKGKFNMVVGDGKQAIYRWRDGEVMQFVNLPKIYKPLNKNLASIEHILSANHQEKNLGTNYRSSKEIIEFNNSLFSHLAENLGEYKKIYEDQAQKVGKNIDGLVSINYYEGKNNEEKFELEFEIITTHINNSLEDGFHLKDIAILCRNNQEGKEIAENLLLQNISVITADSLLLKNNTQIMCLIAMAKITVNEKDEKSKVKLISGLSKLGLLNESLHQTLIKYKFKYEEDERYKTGFNFNQFMTDCFLDYNYINYKSKGCYETIESFVRLFGFNKKADNYLEFFLHSTMKDPALTLSEYIEWWDENEHKLGVGESIGSNGVRIMTIHKSKGLQFPIVILPIKHTKEKSANIWLDDKEIGMPTALIKIIPSEKNASLSLKIEAERNKVLLDKFNLIYVGTTRPEQRLHLIINRKENPKYEKTEAIYEYLDQSFSKMDFGYNRDNKSFVIGKRHKESKENLADDNSSITLKRYISKPLLKGTTISFNQGNKWLENELNQNREYGIIIHQILAEIKNINDLKKNLLKKINEGVISKDIKTKIEKELTQFLLDDKIKKWFTPSDFLQEKSEKDLLTSTEKILRPDKVIYFENHIDVIDFKSGEIQEKHKNQVYEYVENIQKTTVKPVRGFVVYTHSTEVVPATKPTTQLDLF